MSLVYPMNTIKTKLMNLKRSIRAEFSQPLNRELVIVLGNQKAGTTAIASLLGKASGKSVAIDLFFRIKGQLAIRESIFAKKTTFKDFVLSNKLYFTCDIVKDPNFIFFVDEIVNCFPRAKFVFILRDLRDNIRSILNRLSLPGNLKKLREDDLLSIPHPWKVISQGELPSIKGENYIEVLSNRWVLASNLYKKHSLIITLIKYDDFKESKIESIGCLAHSVGLPVRQDILEFVNIQYQPRGQKITDWETFFGRENLDRIEEICGSLMQEFNYRN